MKHFWTIMVIVGFAIGLGWMIRACNIAGDATLGVAERTLDPDNMINSYEWYFDAYGEIKAKGPQIKQHQAYLAEENDKDERNNLRMELTAMQQSCRELVAKYNANSKKANKSIFQDKDLPRQLSATELCDGAG